jgi:hypothetical protein
MLKNSTFNISLDKTKRAEETLPKDKTPIDVFQLPPSSSKKFRHLRLQEPFRKQFLTMNSQILGNLEHEMQRLIEKILPGIQTFTARARLPEYMSLLHEPPGTLLKMSELDCFVWIAAEVIQSVKSSKSTDKALGKEIYRDSGGTLKFLHRRAQDLEKLSGIYNRELERHFQGLKGAYKSFILNNEQSLKDAKLLFKEHKRNGGCDLTGNPGSKLKISGQLKLSGTNGKLRIWGAEVEECDRAGWNEIQDLSVNCQKGILTSALQEIKARAEFTGPTLNHTLNQIKLSGAEPDAWKSSPFHLHVNKLLAACQYQGFPFEKEEITSIIFQWMKLIGTFDHVFHLLSVTKDVARLTRKNLRTLRENLKIIANGVPGQLDLCCYFKKIESPSTFNLPLCTNWPPYLRCD